MHDLDATIKALEGDITKTSRSNADKSWQEGSIQSIRPNLVEICSDTANYSLVTEQEFIKKYLNTAKKTVSDFFGETVFSLIPVNAGYPNPRYQPDWASEFNIVRTPNIVIFGPDVSKNNRINLNYSRLKKMTDMLYANEINSVRRNLTKVMTAASYCFERTMWNFDWMLASGKKTVGTMALYEKCLFPLLMYHCLATMALDRNEAMKSLQMLQLSRKALLIGEKKTEVGVWLILTKM